MNRNLQKRIAFLIPTLAQGGGERVVSELSLHFPEDIDQTIVLFEERVSYPYKGILRSLNVPLSKNPFLRLFFFFVRFFRFKQLVKQENPSWVISVGAAPALMNIFIGEKSIVRVDNFVSKNFRGFFGALFQVAVRMFFHRATCIVAVSKGIQDDLIQNFGIRKEKIRLIYNPIALKKIHEQSREPIPEAYEPLFRDPVVIHMGRLSNEKGQWHLIRAFSVLKKEVHNAKLIILGEGALRGYLENMIHDFGFEQDVYLLGWQENPYPYLARADVFVLSSLWEGLPDSLLEALGCGLPVISSDCRSGPREILAPSTDYHIQTKDVEHAEYGVLVPVCDGRMYRARDALTKEERILGEAMRDSLRDISQLEAYKKKSQQRAEDFDIEKIIKEWDFLKEI